jgi:hypothetical protein
LTLINELYLAFFVFSGGKRRRINHINFRFVTPVMTDLPKLITSVSGGLTLYSSILKDNSETFVNYYGPLEWQGTY